MQKNLPYIALSIVAAGLSPFLGCSDFEKEPAGSYPSTSSGTGAGGEGGTGPCAVEDGECDVTTETCECDDCKKTAFCVPDQCVDNGLCTYDDACICDDCLTDVVCSDPSKCKDDGKCNSFFEGCVCADCESKPECMDNPISGSGGSGGSGGGSGGSGGSSSGAGGS